MLDSLFDSGKEIDRINVEISYRIIELFSAGLYSSPNKAFEELICNSYDAFASKVSVYISEDLSVEDAYIMIADNGEGLSKDDFIQLWKIGESKKREDPERDKKRLQIGQFGIGKLSTYILARKLTHISYKNKRCLMTTMDYSSINSATKSISLPQIELDEADAIRILRHFTEKDGQSLLSFPIFGDGAEESWTITLLSELKPKAKEIQIGRLKWILSTALPLNPTTFNLYLNGIKIDSSKTKIPVLKEWIIGKDDLTASDLDFCNAFYDDETKQYYVGFDAVGNVYGKFVLYEQSLLGGKSSENGRSHGIFLTIRGRLINLDDPLLGMEPFSHGPFNRCQIIINADGLDSNLTSTRESVKESEPLSQLKRYIQRKFNNELRKFYFENEEKENQKKSIAYRLSQTAYSLSQRPIISFIEKYYDGKIINPKLIKRPTVQSKAELLSLFPEVNDGITIKAIERIEWRIIDSHAPIAQLDLELKTLFINALHPYVANYSGSAKDNIPLENIIIAEVLTEAFMYEVGLDESSINSVINLRDQLLRQLAFSDKERIPAVTQLLLDSLSDVTGLEKAVYRSLVALGFEASQIGGPGKPDGYAVANLGYGTDGQLNSYSLTYDAKSTSKERIQVGTAKLSGLKRHQKDYNAKYCFEVAIGYEGEDDINSAISKEAIQQKVTLIKAKDFAQLLLYSIPNQLGLSQLEGLFQTCFAPLQVSEWIKRFVDNKPEKGPYYAIIDVVYDLQKNDTEPPSVEVIRHIVNQKLKKKYSTDSIKKYLQVLDNIIPGLFHYDSQYAYVESSPDVIKTRIAPAISESFPIGIQEMVISLFGDDS